MKRKPHEVNSKDKLFKMKTRIKVKLKVLACFPQEYQHVHLLWFKQRSFTLAWKPNPPSFTQYSPHFCRALLAHAECWCGEYKPVVRSKRDISPKRDTSISHFGVKTIMAAILKGRSKPKYSKWASSKGPLEWRVLKGTTDAHFGPFEVASFEHFGLERPFNMAAMIVFTPNGGRYIPFGTHHLHDDGTSV